MIEMKSALAKFLKKHGKTIDDFKDTAEKAGKTALGGASLASKKVTKAVKDNPIKSAAAGGAAVGYAAGDDCDCPKGKCSCKKKKKPDYLDD